MKVVSGRGDFGVGAGGSGGSRNYVHSARRQYLKDRFLLSTGSQDSIYWVSAFRRYLDRKTDECLLTTDLRE